MIQPQITLPAKVIRVLDGDTIEVELSLPIKVRMLNNWASETDSPDPVEKVKALAAREYLKNQLPPATSIMLYIPLPENLKIEKMFTFGRVLAEVLLDGDSVSAKMVELGLTKPTKKSFTPNDSYDDLLKEYFGS